MKPRNNISLPNFSLPMLRFATRCAKCKMQIGMQHIVSAGIQRMNDGTPCFGYEYKCSICQTPCVVLDTLRKFTRPNWWNQLAEWHDATPPPSTSIDHPATDAQPRFQPLPTVGVMIIDIGGLESISIRGGYRGETGPIYLLYDGEADGSSCGLLRLERDHHIRFCNLDASHCLTRLSVTRFLTLPDSTSFEKRGLTWIKMSANEITRIIADNVFNVLLDEPPVTTPKSRKRSGHEGTKSQKGRRRTRHPPRDPGPMDS